MSLTHKPQSSDSNSNTSSYNLNFDPNGIPFVSRLEAAKEWKAVSNELEAEILSPLLSQHDSVLQTIFESTPSQELYVTGGSVARNIETLEISNERDGDIDIFIPEMNVGDFDTFITSIQQRIPGCNFEIRRSFGDPDGRVVIKLKVGDSVYDISMFKGDFLPYSQELILGQVVVDYSPSKSSVLSCYDGLDNMLGIFLPLDEKNLNSSEWVYSCLRYLSEVCMHGGIYPDIFILKLIKKRFDSFDITTLSDDEIYNLDIAFNRKLKESFDRINTSKEKDSRTFIAFLGYTHILKKLIPVSWTLSHISDVRLYSMLANRVIPFTVFQGAFRFGDIKNINENILSLANISREELQDDSWRFSVSLNSRILKSARQYFDDETRRKGIKYFKANGENLTYDSFIDTFSDSYDEFCMWRAVHLWERNFEIRKNFKNFDDFLSGYSELVQTSELLNGTASSVSLIAFSIFEIAIKPYTFELQNGSIKEALIRRFAILRFLDDLGFKERKILTSIPMDSLLHSFEKFTPIFFNTFRKLIPYLYIYGFNIKVFKKLDEEYLKEIFRELPPEKQDILLFRSQD